MLPKICNSAFLFMDFNKLSYSADKFNNNNPAADALFKIIFLDYAKYEEKEVSKKTHFILL